MKTRKRVYWGRGEQRVCKDAASSQALEDADRGGPHGRSQSEGPWLAGYSCYTLRTVEDQSKGGASLLGHSSSHVTLP